VFAALRQLHAADAEREQKSTDQRAHLQAVVDEQDLEPIEVVAHVTLSAPGAGTQRRAYGPGATAPKMGRKALNPR